MLVIEEIAIKLNDLEALYNKGKVELKSKSIMAELLEKKKAHEILSSWATDYSRDIIVS